MKITPKPEELTSSGLGKVIVTLSKHKQETADNKKICNILIRRWAALACGIPSNETYNKQVSTNFQRYSNLPISIFLIINRSPSSEKSRKRSLDEAFENEYFFYYKIIHLY